MLETMITFSDMTSNPPSFNIQKDDYSLIDLIVNVLTNCEIGINAIEEKSRNKKRERKKTDFVFFLMRPFLQP